MSSPPAAGRLRRVFDSDQFVITCELECPRNASATNVERQARGYAPWVAAVTCTDNSAAIARMSPLAAAAIVARTGVAVTLQLNCRDRNRLALQSDILGAAAVGAGGIVCLSGDPPAIGNHPEATAVYDLTSVELIAMVREMRMGRFLSGDPLAHPPDLLIGCVENPADGAASVERLAAKVAAGAEFVQTQLTFDVERFARWIEQVRAAGLDRSVRIFAGVAPVRRPAIARYLAEGGPGVLAPAAVLRRLETAADPESEGVQIAAELIGGLRAVAGVAGIHLMTFGWVDGVRRVATAIGS